LHVASLTLAPSAAHKTGKKKNKGTAPSPEVAGGEPTSPGSRLDKDMSAAPAMATPAAEAVLEDVVVGSPPPPPVAQSPKYPAMMQSGGAADVPGDELAVAGPSVDLGPQAPPTFLVPPSVHSQADVQQKVESFDAAFAPLRNLTADDVVVGCSAHGADFLGQSGDHLRRFKAHAAAVDLSQGAGGFAGSLEAGELANLPLAAGKGAVGLSLYSTATVARFAPAVARGVAAKLDEWRVADKYAVVKTVVVERAKQGFALVGGAARRAFSFVKAKVDDARGAAPPLPVAEAPEKA
jgi:hypothetical protein